MSTPDPVTLLLPVLDGTNPSQWTLWGKTLKIWCDDYYSAQRQTPSKYKYLANVCMRVSLQAEALLYQRQPEDWVRVIGVIADGNASARIETEERIIRLCSAVARAPDAYYRNFQSFHVGLLVADEASYDQSLINFGHDLRTHLSDLMQVRVRVQQVDNRRSFRTMLQYFESEAIYAWMVNPAT